MPQHISVYKIAVYVCAALCCNFVRTAPPTNGIYKSTSRNTLKYIKIVKQITKKINKKFKKSNKIENLKAEHEYEIPSCSFKEKKLL